MTIHQRINEITEDSILDLYEYDHREEGNEIIVWNKDKSMYLATDYLGLEIIKMLTLKKSIREIKQCLILKYNNRYKQLLFHDLLTTLIDTGIVKRINGKEITSNSIIDFSISLRLLDKYARNMTSQNGVKFYVMLICLGVCSIVTLPDSIFFMSETYLRTKLYLTVLYTVFMSMILMMLHETGHYLAAKSLGIDAVIKFRMKFIFIVAVTSVTDLWSKPKQYRYRVYFAGIVVDLLVASTIGMIIQVFYRIELPNNSLLLYFMIFTLYMIASKILMQLMIISKTDLYWALSTWFDCKNLYSESASFLTVTWKNIMRREKRTDVFLEKYQSPKQRIGIILFSMVLLISVIVSVGILGFYIAPFIYRQIFVLNMLKSVIEQLMNSPLRLSIFIMILIFTVIGFQKSHQRRYRSRNVSIGKNI